jgi:hypothetical protein
MRLFLGKALIMTLRLHATIIALASLGSANACSCFGPQTFCGTLDPPYPEPEWWIPDAVVLGVKLSSVAHGMDILVIQSFSGEAHPDDTVRVWGDNGLLCRWYADAWNVGDTAVWALRWTDFAGGAMEQPGDYLISICGVYALTYSAGMVGGPLTQEGVEESLSLSEFDDLVDGCLSTGIAQHEVAPSFELRSSSSGVSVLTDGRWSPDARLDVFDPSGRLLTSLALPSKESVIVTEPLSRGAYVFRLRDAWHNAVRKWIVQ